MRSFIHRGLGFMAVLALSLAAYADAPMTKLTISVKTDSGRPVNQAEVIVRFIKGHSVFKLGKAIRTSFELRTNQEGQASIPTIPQGNIRVQVYARGYQTYGQIIDVTEAEKTIDVKLNPPQQQYTSHQ